MSAPTLWEEGTWSGTRVTRFSVLLLCLLIGTSLLVWGELGPVFDVGFVVVCVFMAMAVRHRDFFRVGVLPPLLLFGVCLVLAAAWVDAIAGARDGIVQGTVSGLAHRSAGLFIGYTLALLLLALRHRVITRAVRRRKAAAQRPPVHSNLSVSPAPTRTTSQKPSDMSTTVVGSEPHSPESMTASSS